MIGVNMESDKIEISNLLAEHSNIKVVFLGGVDWKDEKEIQKMIMQFDVGIATLLKHPIQLAKSGIKAKQYMNNGVPVICNDLPGNKNVVIDGFNGFICNSISEFSKQISDFRNMKDEHYWWYSKNARK